MQANTKDTIVAEIKAQKYTRLSIVLLIGKLDTSASIPSSLSKSKCIDFLCQPKYLNDTEKLQIIYEELGISVSLSRRKKFLKFIKRPDFLIGVIIPFALGTLLTIYYANQSPTKEDLENNSREVVKEVTKSFNETIKYPDIELKRLKLDSTQRKEFNEIRYSLNAEVNKTAIQLKVNKLSDPLAKSILYTLVGNIFFELKEYKKAVEYYDLAIYEYKENITAMANKARALIKMGQYDDAIVALNRAIGLNDTLTILYYNRGEAYHKLDSLGLATIDYEKTIELDSGYSASYNNLGLIFFDESDYKKAKLFYDKAIELDPKYANAYNNRGILFQTINQYNKAISDFNKAIEFSPDMDQPHANLGNLFFNKLEDTLKAEIEYKKAINLNPENYNAQYNLGVLFQRKKQFTLASLHFKKAFDVNPNYLEAYYALAIILSDDLPNYREAIFYYDKIISLDPNSSKTYNRRGMVFLKMLNYEKALHDFNKAIQINDKDDMAYNNRGKVFFDQGKDYNKAMHDFNKAILINPNESGYFWNRYLLYKKMGQNNKAEEDLIRARKLDPKKNYE